MLALAEAWPAKLTLLAPLATRQTREGTPPGRVGDSPMRHAGAPRCPTRQRNAHRITRREVVYAWHPWAGCRVDVVEIVGKVKEPVARCRRGGDRPGRCLELPLWMFDRAICASTRIEPRPCADLGALAALAGLLSEAKRAACAKPPAFSSRTAKMSPHQTQGDAHAKPHDTTTMPSRPDRAVRANKYGQPHGNAGVAQPSRRDATNPDGSDGAPHPRACGRRARHVGRGGT